MKRIRSKKETYRYTEIKGYTEYSNQMKEFSDEPNINPYTTVILITTLFTI